MENNRNEIRQIAAMIANGNICEKDIVSQFNTMHRCHQTSFVRCVILPIIKAMADAYEKEYTDARNINAAKTCYFLWGKFKEETGTDVPCLM